MSTTATTTDASKGIVSRLSFGTLVNNVNTHSAGGIIGTAISDWVAPFILSFVCANAIKGGNK